MKMKDSKKMSALLIKIAKKAAKNDLNSTSSPWYFQPKLPRNAKKYMEK